MKSLTRLLGIGALCVGLASSSMYTNGCSNAQLLTAGGAALGTFGKTNEQVGAGIIANQLGQTMATEESKTIVNVNNQNSFEYLDRLEQAWNSNQRNLFIACKGWTDINNNNRIEIGELIDIRDDFDFNDEKEIVSKIIGQKGKAIRVEAFYKASNMGLGLLTGLLGDNQRSKVLVKNNDSNILILRTPIDYTPGTLLVKYYADDSFIGSKQILIK
jgi:hypothetical protein